MRTLVKKLVFIAISLSSTTSTNVVAADKANGTPYVDSNKPFLEIKDVNRQAEAWAMCAATYDVIAEILIDTQPARSQYLKNLANGAEIAAGMSVVVDGIVPDITQERFNSLWEVAKLTMTELPKTSQTMLLADSESTSNKAAAEAYFANLNATMNVCFKNLEAQQMYIDAWRELAKSGLLKLPSE